MVTKSRLSPFANTKMQRVKKDKIETVPLRPEASDGTKKENKFDRLLSLIDISTTPRQKTLLPVKKLKSSLLLINQLRKTLYGFIVFEVSWTNVRGISYINELQTDTSLAIEAKLTQRWEFDNVAQAAFCISSWFTGTPYEQLLLMDYLNSATGEVYYDAQEDLLGSVNFGVEVYNIDELNDELSFHDFEEDFSSYHAAVDDNIPLCTPPPTEGSHRRKLTKFSCIKSDIGSYSGRSNSSINDTDSHVDTFCGTEAIQYKDILILFRFNDRDLPFKLRQIIMSDLRLLRLLESGLPSWVIFLQSYPVLCHFYRPWMCPLARSLYVLISIVTVLIGFYDLYKNVPVLKATVSGIFGPLFDWIETWEMISRIKYLGTMLFLHNIQRALQWFLAIARTARSFLTVLTQPLMQPLLETFGHFLPFWNACMEVADNLYSFVLVIIISIIDLAGSLIASLIWPVQFILSAIWNFSSSIIYPIFCLLCGVLHTLVRLVIAISNLIYSILACAYYSLGDIWMTVSRLSRLASASEVTSMSEASGWRSLWNDLFSQVFRALRSIVNGFIAFFTTCNRHRLSIYNHMEKLMHRSSCRRSGHDASQHRQHHEWESRAYVEGRKSI